MKYYVRIEFSDPKYNVTTLPFDTLEEAMEVAEYEEEEYYDYGGVAVILTEDEL